MPRANRYIVPGFAYHLTHRCHNRKFLLKFALDRQRYRIRLRQALVDSAKYLWECLQYIELNMVRCGAVAHPSQWEWSGYGEMMGTRKRNRLLNLDKLLELSGARSIEEFREHFLHGLDERIEKGRLERQAMWTDALAVGSQPFVEAMKGRIRHRQLLETVAEGGTWVLREVYEPVFGTENSPITLPEVLNREQPTHGKQLFVVRPR